MLYILFCMQNAKISHNFLHLINVKLRQELCPFFTLLLPYSDLYYLVVFNTVFVSKI